MKKYRNTKKKFNKTLNKRFNKTVNKWTNKRVKRTMNKRMNKTKNKRVKRTIKRFKMRGGMNDNAPFTGNTDISTQLYNDAFHNATANGMGNLVAIQLATLARDAFQNATADGMGNLVATQLAKVAYDAAVVVINEGRNKDAMSAGEQAYYAALFVAKTRLGNETLYVNSRVNYTGNAAQAGLGNETMSGKFSGNAAGNAAQAGLGNVAMVGEAHAGPSQGIVEEAHAGPSQGIVEETQKEQIEEYSNNDSNNDDTTWLEYSNNELRPALNDFLISSNLPVKITNWGPNSRRPSKLVTALAINKAYEVVTNHGSNRLSGKWEVDAKDIMMNVASLAVELIKTGKSAENVVLGVKQMVVGMSQPNITPKTLLEGRFFRPIGNKGSAFSTPTHSEEQRAVHRATSELGSGFNWKQREQQPVHLMRTKMFEKGPFYKGRAMVNRNSNVAKGRNFVASVKQHLNFIKFTNEPVKLMIDMTIKKGDVLHNQRLICEATLIGVVKAIKEYDLLATDPTKDKFVKELIASGIHTIIINTLFGFVLCSKALLDEYIPNQLINNIIERSTLTKYGFPRLGGSTFSGGANDEENDNNDEGGGGGGGKVKARPKSNTPWKKMEEKEKIPAFMLLHIDNHDGECVWAANMNMLTYYEKFGKGIYGTNTFNILFALISSFIMPGSDYYNIINEKHLDYLNYLHQLVVYDADVHNGNLPLFSFIIGSKGTTMLEVTISIKIGDDVTDPIPLNLKMSCTELEDIAFELVRQLFIPELLHCRREDLLPIIKLYKRLEDVKKQVRIPILTRRPGQSKESKYQVVNILQGMIDTEIAKLTQPRRSEGETTGGSTRSPKVTKGGSISNSNNKSQIGGMNVRAEVGNEVVIQPTLDVWTNEEIEKSTREGPGAANRGVAGAANRGVGKKGTVENASKSMRNVWQQAIELLESTTKDSEQRRDTSEEEQIDCLNHWIDYAAQNYLNNSNNQERTQFVEKLYTELREYTGLQSNRTVPEIPGVDVDFGAFIEDWMKKMPPKANHHNKYLLFDYFLSGIKLMLDSMDTDSKRRLCLMLRQIFEELIFEEGHDFAVSDKRSLDENRAFIEYIKTCLKASMKFEQHKVRGTNLVPSEISDGMRLMRVLQEIGTEKVFVLLRDEVLNFPRVQLFTKDGAKTIAGASNYNVALFPMYNVDLYIPWDIYRVTFVSRFCLTVNTEVLNVGMNNVPPKSATSYGGDCQGGSLFAHKDGCIYGCDVGFPIHPEVINMTIDGWELSSEVRLCKVEPQGNGSQIVQIVERHSTPNYIGDDLFEQGTFIIDENGQIICIKLDFNTLADIMKNMLNAEANAGRAEAGAGRAEAGAGRAEAGAGRAEAGAGRAEAGAGRAEGKLYYSFPSNVQKLFSDFLQNNKAKILKYLEVNVKSGLDGRHDLWTNIFATYITNKCGEYNVDEIGRETTDSKYLKLVKKIYEDNESFYMSEIDNALREKRKIIRARSIEGDGDWEIEPFMGDGLMTLDTFRQKQIPEVSLYSSLAAFKAAVASARAAERATERAASGPGSRAASVPRAAKAAAATKIAVSAAEVAAPPRRGLGAPAPPALPAAAPLPIIPRGNSKKQKPNSKPFDPLFNGSSNEE